MAHALPAPGQRPAHVPALDGLRAIAALGVIAFHTNWLPFGWAGVWLFFVLSGYLITRILVAERERCVAKGGGRSFFGRFYWRRSLRIFPLAALYLGGLWLYHQYQPVRGLDVALPYLATYTYNLQTWADLLGPRVIEWSMLFSHFWSLAIEEQFYLFWPALVWFLSPRAFRRVTVGLVLAGPLIRFASATWLTEIAGGDAFNAAYLLTPSHVDAFAWGAGLALFGDQIRARVTAPGTLATVLFVVTLAGTFAANADLLGRGVGASAYWESLLRHRALLHHGTYVWVFTLLSAGSVGLVLYALRAHELGRRTVLESRALQYLGRISYGLYVYHAAALVTVGWGLGQLGVGIEPWTLGGVLYLVGTAALAIAAAHVSFYVWERYFLQLKNWRPGLAVRREALTASS